MKVIVVVLQDDSPFVTIKICSDYIKILEGVK